MQTVEKVRTKAHLSNEITELEKKNRKVALRAAEEGIVLLENSGVLPLAKGSKVAMYGDGVTNTVKCGSGSGEVNERKSTTIYEGMKLEGFVITTESILADYKKMAKRAKEEYFAEQQKKAGFLNFGVTMASMSQPYMNPPFPKLKKSDLDSETDICIFVVSRISGESYDRKAEKGDYYLSEQEEANIRLCASHYAHMILIINAGGMVDFGSVKDIRFDSVLFMSMLGTAGGEALARVLSGKVNPSGHLTDTWPVNYEDIPYAKEYSYLNGDVDKEYYKEDIYVGYRYFDTFGVEPKYAFGYGLSYTDFSVTAAAETKQDKVIVSARVSNIGGRSGKEVVQVYVSCPNGELEKEYQKLAAFAKTKELAAGESQELTLEFSLRELASYDERNACYLLEKGDYVLRVGNSSRNTKETAVLRLEETVVVSRHEHICPCSSKFDVLRQQENGKVNQPVSADCPVVKVNAGEIETVVCEYSEPEIYHDAAVDSLMGKLTPDEMADVVVGCGNDMLIPMKHYYTVPGATGYSTNKYFDRGICDIAFCDGPAGLRFQQQSVAVKGKNKVKGITSSIELLNFLPSLVRKMAFGKPGDGTTLYQYITAFPVGTAAAQTWNTELVEEIGRTVNSELEEYGVTVWLAPGMNIHRNPLCGRNYEYYSEDPLLTGKMAAAMTRGAQCSGNHSVSLKHFFCNNQETNRGKVSSEVHERAIREIYLKGFEIAVKEGKAKGVMTSYNRVNGVYSAVNRDAVTKVLRCEWGFDGLVLTDWDSWKPDCDADVSMYAGVDILMQGDGKQRKQIKKALKAGTLDEKYVRRNASRVLRLISKVDWEK